MVAQNDHMPADHFDLALRCEKILRSNRRSVQLIVYPPYGTDGHRLFFELGSYWPDVVRFLKEYL